MSIRFPNKTKVQIIFRSLVTSSSRWRYSPGWALASSTICLQTSRFLALSLHSFTPIFLRSMDTSSSHLIFGLPLRLVAYSFPYNIFFGDCGVLHSFYVTKPSYYLALNKPENVLPPWLWLLIHRFIEFSIIRFLSIVHIFSVLLPIRLILNLCIKMSSRHDIPMLPVRYHLYILT